MDSPISAVSKLLVEASEGYVWEDYWYNTDEKESYVTKFITPPLMLYLYMGVVMVLGGVCLAAAVYTMACINTARNVNFNKAMKNMSWATKNLTRRLIFWWPTLITSAYLFQAAALGFSFTLMSVDTKSIVTILGYNVLIYIVVMVQCVLYLLSFWELCSALLIVEKRLKAKILVIESVILFIRRNSMAISFVNLMVVFLGMALPVCFSVIGNLSMGFNFRSRRQDDWVLHTVIRTTMGFSKSVMWVWAYALLGLNLVVIVSHCIIHDFLAQLCKASRNQSDESPAEASV